MAKLIIEGSSEKLNAIARLIGGMGLSIKKEGVEEPKVNSFEPEPELIEDSPKSKAEKKSKRFLS